MFRKTISHQLQTYSIIQDNLAGIPNGQIQKIVEYDSYKLFFHVSSKGAAAFSFLYLKTETGERSIEYSFTWV